MSRTLFSLAGFQVITIGRFWVIAEVFGTSCTDLTASTNNIHLLFGCKSLVSMPLTAYTIKKYYAPLETFPWDYKSLHKSYVGSQGWKEFYRDLAETIRKKYPEFKSL